MNKVFTECHMPQEISWIDLIYHSKARICDISDNSGYTVIVVAIQSLQVQGSVQLQTGIYRIVHNYRRDECDISDIISH